jgi:hypothetical protein
MILLLNGNDGSGVGEPGNPMGRILEKERHSVAEVNHIDPSRIGFASLGDTAFLVSSAVVSTATTEE